MGSVTKTFFDRPGDHLASKWQRPYIVVVHWLRVKMSMVLLRVTDLCLRGTRSRLRPMLIEYDAPINPSILNF
uniref:Uncharacterized protein n=1 Tax=Amphimedon queenslandica TaxID=400682 RepID=A0A1X7T7P1_AMPQE